LRLTAGHKRSAENRSTNHQPVCNGSQINTVKDMKEQILEIAEKLGLELITENQAQDLLLGLFGVSFSFKNFIQIKKYERISKRIRGIYEANN
jgi:hypothetical protein